MTTQEAGWTGRGKLEQLVAELDRQQKTKVDFVTDTRDLEVALGADGKGLVLRPRVVGGNPTRASEWLTRAGMPIKFQALEQIAGRCTPSVSGRFLQEMVASEPKLLAGLVDELTQHNPKRRFIRCLDGSVRSFHSNRYRVLDHYSMAFSALDAVRAAGGEVIEAQLSDKHMRIKFTTRALWDVINQATKEGKSIPRGRMGNQDYLRGIGFGSGGALPGGPGTVFPLVTLSNSETGHGGHDVQVGLFEGACANGMIFESAVSRVHLGGSMEVGGFSDETLNAESKAVYLKARDAIRMAFTKEGFAKIVAAAKGCQDDVIRAPQAAVQNVAKAAGLSDESKDILLGYFIREYDQNRLGLAQATARFAQDTGDAERSHELEVVAGSILRKEVALV